MGIEIKSSDSKAEQGNYITCKSKNEIHYQGPDGDMTGVLVGNGSKVKAVISYYDWEFKGKKGRSPGLKKLVITKLEVYEGSEDGVDLDEALQTMKLLIDADVSCYAVGYSTQNESEETALETMRGKIVDLIAALYEGQDSYSWQLFLTGPSAENFRHDYAVTAEYKGNRKSNEKPTHFQALRDYLIEEWDAQVSEGCEADDEIAEAEENCPDCVIVSIDKDFDQCVGWRYNPNKGELYEVTEESGKLWFYQQFLIGDRVDAIVGADGIGAVKSLKLLEGKTEAEMWNTVVDILGYDRAVENGHLLYLRRHKGVEWTPPTETGEDQ